MDSGAQTTDSKGTNTLTNNGVAEDTSDFKQGDASGIFVAADSDNFSITDANLDAGFPLKNGDANKKISVCNWVKFTDITITGWDGMWSKAGTGKESLELGIIDVAGTKRVQGFLGFNNGVSTEAFTDTETAIVAGRWYHIGFTYQDSDKSWRIRIWDDTASSVTDKTGNTTNNINVEDAPFQINGNPDGHYLDMRVDELVVFKDILGTGEIDQIREGTFGAVTTTTTSSSSTSTTTSTSSTTSSSSSTTSTSSTSSSTSTSTSTSSTTSSTSSTASTSSTSSSTSTSTSTSSTTSSSSTTTAPPPVEGEIHHNFKTGQTLYLCRFQTNGEVFLTDGSADEEWGNDGRDADDYDVSMTEIQKGSGESRHYVGPFDLSGNIEAGKIYHFAVYHQKGGNPADTDKPLGQGVIEWGVDGEITLVDITVDISVVSDDLRRVKNVYGQDTLTSEGVFPEVNIL